jgi:hypothetical protein
MNKDGYTPLSRQGRLGNIALVGGSGEIQFIGNGKKLADLMHLHRSALNLLMPTPRSPNPGS